MNTTTAGVVFVAVLVSALALAYGPLGDYMQRVYTSPNHLRVERGAYRLVGVDPDVEQRWGIYLRSVLAFSLVGVLFLYAFLRLQNHLLLSLGLPAMEQGQAFNTASSFVTNTNWQSYSGESTLGHLVQMAGLAVQNFVSAAVGMSVAIALIRGFTRRGTEHVGNFWVDLTRTCLRILLPIAAVAAVVLVAGGAIENLHGTRTVSTLVGAKQSITGGPVASQEAIKELGTNGGGFYNANSAHPFENPTGWTNWLEIFLLLVIPFSLPRTFGRMVANTRQGLVIVAVMAGLLLTSLAVNAGFQMAHHGTVPTSVAAASEGTETRFGVPQSSAFATATTGTSTGAVDSFHDSYTSIAGGTLLLNMMFGEVAPVEVPVVAEANTEDCGTPNRVSVPSLAAATEVGTVPWWAIWKPALTARLVNSSPAITATMTRPCLVLATIRPNVRGRLNGITSSRKISSQFVQPVGFSNGWAELAL